MKKYMTIAALLAAGTAFANADSQTLSFSEGTATFQAIDLTKDWELSFTVTMSPATITEAGAYWGTVLSSDALNVTVIPEEGDIGSLMGNVGTVGIINSSSVTTDWSELYPYMPTNFKFVYTAGTKSADISVAPVFNGNVGTAIYSETLGGIEFESTTLASISTGAASVGWTNPTGTITGTLAAVPEPSAFGLLAGIGALALVASRRRRK